MDYIDGVYLFPIILKGRNGSDFYVTGFSLKNRTRARHRTKAITRMVVIFGLFINEDGSSENQEKIKFFKESLLDFPARRVVQTLFLNCRLLAPLTFYFRMETVGTKRHPLCAKPRAC